MSSKQIIKKVPVQIKCGEVSRDKARRGEAYAPGKCKGREISMNIVSSTKIPKYSYVYILEGKFNILSKTKKIFLVPEGILRRNISLKPQ